MNKCYIIVINDDSQAIYAHDNQTAALSQFHTEMAYAYAANVNRTSIVIDTYGAQIKRERYSVPVEVAEEIAE